MMKNTRVLSCFFIFFPLSCFSFDVWLRIPDLSAANLEHIRQLGAQYPGKSISIEVIPEATFWQKISNALVPRRSPGGHGGSPDNEGSGFFSSNGHWAITALKYVGCGSLVSYGTIFYFIYRVYRIMGKVSSVMNWWNKKEAEKEDSDSLMDDMERMLFRNITKRYKNSTRSHREMYARFLDDVAQEKALLIKFQFLLSILNNYSLRSLFPCDQSLDESVESKLEGLKYFEECIARSYEQGE